MRKQQRLISAALSLALSLIMGSAVFATTLKDTLRNAYNNSGLLEQNRALLMAADEDVARAVTALRPVVNYAAQFGTAPNNNLGTNVENITLSFSAELLLYDFGRSQQQIERLKEVVLATRQSLLAIEQNVLLRAIRAHLNHRRNAELVKLRMANVALIEKELNAANERFEVGQTTRTNISLAEARLASAQALLAQARGEEMRSMAEYIAAVGTTPDNLQAPNDLPALSLTLEQAIARARTEHPQLKQIQHAISAAEIELARVKSAYKPSIKLSGSISSNDSDWQDVAHRASISAGGPIYAGGALQSAIRKAQAQRDATRAQLHTQYMNIDQGVRNAFIQRDVAAAGLEASVLGITAATIAFDGMQKEAALGARTTLDVLNAEQELLDARNSKVSAQIDAQIATFSIRVAMGDLTAKKLDLGVKIYDPEQYYNLAITAPLKNTVASDELQKILQDLSE